MPSVCYGQLIFNNNLVAVSYIIRNHIIRILYCFKFVYTHCDVIYLARIHWSAWKTQTRNQFYRRKTFSGNYRNYNTHSSLSFNWTAAAFRDISSVNMAHYNTWICLYALVGRLVSINSVSLSVIPARQYSSTSFSYYMSIAMCIQRALSAAIMHSIHFNRWPIIR